jgi:hypothetical protein
MVLDNLSRKTQGCKFVCGFLQDNAPASEGGRYKTEEKGAGRDATARKAVLCAEKSSNNGWFEHEVSVEILRGARNAPLRMTFILNFEALGNLAACGLICLPAWK